MSQTFSIDNNEISKWFQKLIEEYNKLTKESDRKLRYFPSMYGDFAYPCRVFVVCTVQPATQLVIVHNDPGVKRVSIEVYGPKKGAEFVHTAHEILKEEWLSRKLKRIESPSFMYYRDFMDRDLLTMAKMVNARVEWQKKNPSKEYLGPPMIFPRTQNYQNSYYSWYSTGNLLLEDPLQFAKRAYDSRVLIKKPSTEMGKAGGQVLQDSTFQTTKAFISAFYPPLCLGELPMPSYYQRVTSGAYIPSIFDPAYFEYRGCKITIYRNGYLIISVEDRNACLRYLNQIMGMFLISGIAVEAVTAADLGGSSMYQNGNIASYRVPATKSPERSRIVQLDDSVMNESELKVFKRRQVPEQKIRDIISSAEKVPNDIASYLIWTAQAFTVLCRSEYNQAFFHSWKIIEKDLERRFNTIEKEDEGSPERKKERSRPTIPHMLEVLLKSGSLRENEHTKLLKLNYYRTNIVHHEIFMTFSQAKDSFDLAFQIVLSSLGIKNSNAKIPDLTESLIYIDRDARFVMAE